MYRRSFVIVFVLVALLGLFVGVAAAQDDATAPDNLCDEGQIWGDGRCNSSPLAGGSERAWECGWYQARVLYQGWSNEQIPDYCVNFDLPGVDQLCRSLADSLNANATLCLRSDQTGAVSAPGEDTLVFLRFLQNEARAPQACPAIDGYAVVTVLPASFFESFYTPQELYSELGLLPSACLYMPAGQIRNPLG
ncbi:MAG: hypothetical protein KJ065_24490 [Anaerolineae bacterium]|nr:hypothetical protein [Anaerolineae bacterium]